MVSVGTRQSSAMVTLRTSSRLAALRAQTAIKRTVEDLDGSAQEEPAKRARLAAVGDEESSQTDGSDASQSTLDGAYVEDTPAIETIIVSMAGAAKKESGAAPKVKNVKPINGSPSVDKPLVWANARGSLCEALPYFRAFKGSLHSANLVVQGFLVDQEVDQRDVFGGQVIISSV
jgi:hypothetical protein